MRPLILFLPVLLVVFAAAAQATIIHVPGDYPTIQEGINAAAEFDTVLVGPGIYPENVTDIGIDNITLLGTKGQAIIQGPAGARGIDIDYVRGWEIGGFELSNCWNHGIRVYASEDCSVHDNYCHNTYGNVGNHGIGITSCLNITVRNNVTSECSGSGNCAGIWIWGTRNCDVFNNTVYGNKTDGIIVSMTGVGVHIYNNISVYNGSTGIEFQNNNGAYPDPGAVRYNDSWSNIGENYAGCLPGDGAISIDPLFVLEIQDDYRLLWDSPCIDTGDPNLSDSDGTRSDMGAHYFNQDDYLTLYLTPDTKEVLPGDVFGITCTLINRWDNPEPFWYLAQGRKYGGAWFTFFGPIKGNLPAHYTVQVHATRPVPNMIPTGTYEYRSLIGMPPGILYDRDGFIFRVI